MKPDKCYINDSSSCNNHSNDEIYIMISIAIHLQAICKYTIIIVTFEYKHIQMQLRNKLFENIKLIKLSHLKKWENFFQKINIKGECQNKDSFNTNIKC